jgi:hypothetical protein
VLNIKNNQILPGKGSVLPDEYVDSIVHAIVAESINPAFVKTQFLTLKKLKAPLNDVNKAIVSKFQVINDVKPVSFQTFTKTFPLPLDHFEFTKVALAYFPCSFTGFSLNYNFNHDQVLSSPYIFPALADTSQQFLRTLFKNPGLQANLISEQF